MPRQHIYSRLRTDQLWTSENFRGYIRGIPWGLFTTISLREVFELWIKPPVQVPCVVAREGCGSAGVRCTPMMEHHDVGVVIEGRPPELGRRRVYHRDGCSSIGPRRRRCPRFCAAPISARQHLIHIVATLSYPLSADLTAHSLSSANFLRPRRIFQNFV